MTLTEQLTESLDDHNENLDRLLKDRQQHISIAKYCDNEIEIVRIAIASIESILDGLRNPKAR